MSQNPTPTSSGPGKRASAEMLKDSPVFQNCELIEMANNVRKLVSTMEGMQQTINIIREDFRVISACINKMGKRVDKLEVESDQTKTDLLNMMSRTAALEQQAISHCFE